MIAAVPNTELLEYSLAESLIRKDLLTEPLYVLDGYAKISEKPGLGIEVNPDVVTRYRVA